MKKTMSIILVTITILSCFCGCTAKTTKGKLNVVCTTYPIYDWVMQILGDNPGNINCSMLIDNGVDLHSYQPTADDILAVKTADLFIYIGGESDNWVKDALKDSKQKHNGLSLLEMLKNFAIPEDQIKTVNKEKLNSSNANDIEYDEHIWLSAKNARRACQLIARNVIRIDHDNVKIYQNNLREYTNKIFTLERSFEDKLAQTNNRTLVFADRFPFVYLCNDYKIEYYAAFSGCSAETEASFEKISLLAQKVDELKIKHILVIDGGKHNIAKTVINNTKAQNQDILTLNSFQSVNKKSNSYLEIMESNFDTIIKALG